MSYQTDLGKALSNSIDTVASVRPNKTNTAKGWTHREHSHNNLSDDIEQIKRDVRSMNFWLQIGVSLLALVFVMLLIIWF